MGCKLDLRYERQVMALIMQFFHEIETNIKCSTLRLATKGI
jgi:hypothetical protein